MLFRSQLNANPNLPSSPVLLTKMEANKSGKSAGMSEIKILFGLFWFHGRDWEGAEISNGGVRSLASALDILLTLNLCSFIGHSSVLVLVLVLI